MTCCCAKILFFSVCVVAQTENIHGSDAAVGITQPQTDTVVQFDTDCGQDFIVQLIAHGVTCNKRTQSLLSHSVKAP